MSVTTTSLTPRSGTLGVQLAAHLLRRASLHFSKSRVDELAVMTATQAVNELFDNPAPTPYIPRPLDPMSDEPMDSGPYNNIGGEWIDDDTNNTREGYRRRYVSGWWLRNALYDTSATHKLAFFLHTLFTGAIEGVSSGSYYQISRFFYDHLALLNYAAENGMNLKAFAGKMTLDNFMLCYLDNRSNENGDVVENYAREFLELFTIAPGEQLGSGIYTNYTEMDVNELARLLTGFTTKNTRNGSDIDSETGIYTGYADATLHDSGNKTFSSQLSGSNSGATIMGRSDAAGMYEELEEIIDIVFDRMETAQNYARKMYRFYVVGTIDEDDAIATTIIDALANDLFDNDYNLKATLKVLLKSEHFYDMCTDAAGGGNIIKAPLELLCESLSFFNTDLPVLSTSPTFTEVYIHFQKFINGYLYNRFGQNMGFQLFNPPSVAGHPAYYQEPLWDKNWYNGTTIPTRYGIGKDFIINSYSIENIHHTYIDTVAYANYLMNSGVDVSNADVLVDAVVNYLLPQPLTSDRRDVIRNLFLQNLSPMNWQCEWNLYYGVDSCGQQADEDPDRVRPHLDALVTAVLSSQEFQLK